MTQGELRLKIEQIIQTTTDGVSTKECIALMDKFEQLIDQYAIDVRIADNKQLVADMNNVGRLTNYSKIRAHITNHITQLEKERGE